MDEINKKLEELRKKWLAEPANRGIIEMQAKILKMAMGEKKEDNYEIARKLFK